MESRPYKCSKCGLMFEKTSTSSWCKSCRAKAEANRRLINGIKPRRKWPDPEGKKICRKCEQVFDLTDFTNTSRGKQGKSSYCQICFNAQYKSLPAIAAEYTREYRARHSERWKALHRLHQAARRIKIIKVDIDDKDLKALYSKLNCQYCNKETSIDERTLDHVVSLNKGGIHSLENLVMACRSCNSSKQDKDLEEWLPLLKQKS